MARYGQVDEDYAVRLATRAPEDDGPIYMLNLMKYRAQADYGPDGEKGVTGREADDRYAPIQVLHELGADIVFVGEVLDAGEGWDRVAVVRYPTRRSFIDMQSRPDFKALHVHKDAGMERTIILGTLPAGALPELPTEGTVRLEVSAHEQPGAGVGVFDVEGTIVGDGRQWRRVRWSDSGETSVGPVADGSQALLLRPVLQRW